MKKYWITGGVVMMTITFAVISSCAVRKSEPVKAIEFVPKNDRAANGERVYMMHCEKCHPGGEGGLGPAINPNPAPGFIKRFQMRHGLSVMPSFKKKKFQKKI